MGLGAVSGSGLAAAPYSFFPVLYPPFLVPVRMYVMNKCFAWEGEGGRQGNKSTLSTVPVTRLLTVLNYEITKCYWCANGDVVTNQLTN
jgi:hypothetical protein